ncbi:hypothetical protein ZWY2020_013393 [Hordeum vulgare]|nr:hypothetical protein ZWY2020_013393 [Hordeum vulgare]
MRTRTAVTGEKVAGRDTHLKKLFRGRRRRLPPSCASPRRPRRRSRWRRAVPSAPSGLAAVKRARNSKCAPKRSRAASACAGVRPHSRDGGDAAGGGSQARGGRGFRWPGRARYSGRLPGACDV